MVNYQDSDIISLNEFELAWRITDPRWAALPASVLERIRPLSRVKSRELYALSPLSRPLRYPPDVGQLSITKVHSLEETDTSEGVDGSRWFRELPIERAQQVYVCWGIGDGVAAVTDWGTFTEIWDELWYPFDWMCVLDDTQEWAVLFGPGEIVRFAEKSLERVST